MKADGYNPFLQMSADSVLSGHSVVAVLVLLLHVTTGTSRTHQDEIYQQKS